jgi:hypothetical protein
MNGIGGPARCVAVAWVAATALMACDSRVDFGQVEVEAGAAEGSGGGGDGAGGDAPVSPGALDANDAGPDATLDGSGGDAGVNLLEAAADSPSISDGGPGDASDDGTAEGGIDLLSGTYTGYVESFQFPDGADLVTMHLNLQQNGTVTGTVYFPFPDGGAPLARPTDPSVGYPPGFEWDTPENGAFEGFDFTVQAGTFASGRVQVSIQQAEIWTQWCAIQTPTPKYNRNTPDGSCGEVPDYGCLTNAQYRVDTSTYPATCSISTCTQPTMAPIDCGKLRLCESQSWEIPTSINQVYTILPNACDCTATRCNVHFVGWRTVLFDMRLASGTLNGSAGGLDGQPVHNVHLTRVP